MAISQQEIISELKKTNQVIFDLKNFIEGREGMIIDELPDNLKKSLLQLKMLPPISSTGLEKLERILEDLYIAQYILKLKSQGKPLPGYEEESLEHENIKTQEPFAKSSIQDLHLAPSTMLGTSQGKPTNTVKIPVKEEVETASVQPQPRPKTVSLPAQSVEAPAPRPRPRPKV